jgi:hypothetical protein
VAGRCDKVVMAGREAVQVSRGRAATAATTATALGLVETRPARFHIAGCPAQDGIAGEAPGSVTGAGAAPCPAGDRRSPSSCRRSRSARRSGRDPASSSPSPDREVTLVALSFTFAPLDRPCSSDRRTATTVARNRRTNWSAALVPRLHLGSATATGWLSTVTDVPGGPSQLRRAIRNAL